MALKSDKQIEELMGNVSDVENNKKRGLTVEEALVQKQEQGEVEVSDPSDQPTRRSIRDRYFSKIEAGSVRGSIFAMSSLALGTGCLAIPIQFQQMSVLAGMIMLVLAAIASYWSLSIMIMASRKSGAKDYSKLVFIIFGKGLSSFLDLIILIYIFGILVSYQVIIYDFLGNTVYSLFISQNDYPSYENNFKPEFWKKAYIIYPIMYGIASVILMPLCLLKDIGKMRFISLFGIISLLYTILVIVCEFPFYFHDYLTNPLKKDKSINWYDISVGFTSSLYFFQGASVFFFSYTCHAGAFPVFKSLKNNIQRRVEKVFRRSVIFDALLYILVGLCGYLSVPDSKVPALIINRYNLFENDYFIILGRFSMALALIMNIPANYNAFRISFLEQVFGDTEVTNKRNYLITIPTILISTLIAALYDDILKYINLLGGFCSVILAFVFPGLLYIKTNEYSIKHWKNLITIFVIFILAGIGFTSVYITLVTI